MGNVNKVVSSDDFVIGRADGIIGSDGDVMNT